MFEFNIIMATQTELISRERALELLGITKVSDERIGYRPIQYDGGGFSRRLNFQQCFTGLTPFLHTSHKATNIFSKKVI